MQVFGSHDSGERQDVINCVLKTVYLTHNPSAEVPSVWLDLHTDVVLLQNLNLTEVWNVGSSYFPPAPEESTRIVVFEVGNKIRKKKCK